MENQIPFLKISLPPVASYLLHLESMDGSGIFSNYGPLNTQFEAGLLRQFFGGSGAVTTVSNATAGLALAMRSVARPGAKYAVMPSFTFAATPNAAIWAGLEPFFVDVNPQTWVMDEESLREAVDVLGDSLAVVVPYATFGVPMDLKSYDALLVKGIPVVVDAAPGIGSSFSGAQFGQGFKGIIAFSMHCTKPFGIGEGGLLYSANTNLIAALRSAGNFGFGPDRAAVSVGFNTKLPEISAAVGLAVLDGFTEQRLQRNQIHKWYLNAFKDADFEGRWTLQRFDGEGSHQFMPVLAPNSDSGDEIVAKLASTGIQARRYFSPVCHRQPAFSKSLRGNLANTESLDDRIVSLPLWPGLTESEVQRIVRAVTS